jgi:hypothetical protein
LHSKKTNEKDLNLNFANSIFEARKREHDEYYSNIMSKGLTKEEKNVFISASAGLLFTKQFYYYDLKTWLIGDALQPPPPQERRQGKKEEFINNNVA